MFPVRLRYSPRTRAPWQMLDSTCSRSLGVAVVLAGVEVHHLHETDGALAAAGPHVERGVLGEQHAGQKAGLHLEVVSPPSRSRAPAGRRIAGSRLRLKKKRASGRCSNRATTWRSSAALSREPDRGRGNGHPRIAPWP